MSHQTSYCETINYLSGTTILQGILRNEVEQSNYIEQILGSVRSDAQRNESAIEGSNEEDDTFKIFTPGKDTWLFECAITRYVKYF